MYKMPVNCHQQFTTPLNNRRTLHTHDQSPFDEYNIFVFNLSSYCIYLYAYVRIKI